jgi:hypothetical protein
MAGAAGQQAAAAAAALPVGNRLMRKLAAAALSAVQPAKRCATRRTLQYVTYTT